MLDRKLVERVAGALATDEGLVEKDWHVVRALAAIAAVDHAGAALAFSGGTSLSKGWRLINWIECVFRTLKHLVATEACQVGGEDA